MKRLAHALCVLCLVSGIVTAAEFAPIVNFSMYGGQNKFDGDTSNEVGNASLNIVPSIKFSETFTLIPSYTGEYRIIKEAKELADGNILFQRGLNHNIYIKPVYSISDNLKLKFKAGYMLQQLKEAASEDLSDGAFNHTKTTVGLDVSGESFTAGYSMYSVLFPNYKSVIDTTTASQITGEPGKYILDFAAHDFYVAKKFPVSAGIVLDATLDYTIKQFADQTVVNDLSTYSSDKRSDSSILLNLFPSVAIIPTGPTTLYGGLSLTYILYNSNQNYGDAGRAQYIKSYYNYNEYKLSPALNFSFNAVPLTLGVSYELSVRSYTDRLAQDNSGVYTSDKTNVTTTFLSVNAAYPVMENLTIVVAPHFLTSSSNMKYESLYKYNYNASSIFMGIQYTYE